MKDRHNMSSNLVQMQQKNDLLQSKIKQMD